MLLKEKLMKWHFRMYPTIFKSRLKNFVILLRHNKLARMTNVISHANVPLISRAGSSVGDPWHFGPDPDPYLWLMNPDLDPIPDSTPFFTDFKEAKEIIIFFIFFSFNMIKGTLPSVLKI